MPSILAGTVRQRIEVVDQREIGSYEVGGALMGIRLRRAFRIEKRLKMREMNEMILAVKKGKYLNEIVEVIPT